MTNKKVIGSGQHELWQGNHV